MHAWIRVALALTVASALACEKRDRQAKLAPTPAQRTHDAAVAHAVPGPPVHKAADPDHPGDPSSPPPGPPPFRSTHGDCSTTYAPRPKRDRFPMCKVTGGSFMMGTPAGEVGIKPRHRVRLSSFYMDQLEVTNAQYLVFLNLVGTTDFCHDRVSVDCIDVSDDLPNLPIRRDQSGRFSVPPGMEHYPVVGVSLEGAERYCHWAGKELPTQAQWEYAAAHDPATGHDRKYPWGDIFEPNRANCGKRCKDGFQRLSPVGTFDGTHGHGDGQSAFGLRDMAGNAGEYVRDYYDEPYKVCTPECVDPLTKRNALYGDQWLHRSLDYLSERIETWSTSNTFGGPPFATDGFRCASPIKE